MLCHGCIDPQASKLHRPLDLRAPSLFSDELKDVIKFLVVYNKSKEKFYF